MFQLLSPPITFTFQTRTNCTALHSLKKTPVILESWFLKNSSS